MVNDEGSLASELSVRVGLGNDPCRSIRYTEVEDLARRDKVMETVHDFLHAGGVVPPVNIENIDIAGAKLLERVLDREMQRLDIVTDISRLLLEVVATFVVGRVLLNHRSNITLLNSELMY